MFKVGVTMLAINTHFRILLIVDILRVGMLHLTVIHAGLRSVRFEIRGAGPYLVKCHVFVKLLILKSVRDIVVTSFNYKYLFI